MVLVITSNGGGRLLGKLLGTFGNFWHACLLRSSNSKQYYLPTTGAPPAASGVLNLSAVQQFRVGIVEVADDLSK